MIDWPSLLDRYGVPYRTHGKNVGRDRIVCKCPFCSDDPSEHMSIDLQGRGWRCLRNPEHKGGHPYKLVLALAGPAAAALVRGDAPLRDPTKTLSELIRDKLEPSPPADPPSLPVLQGLRPFVGPSRVLDPYRAYLAGRGFTHWPFLAFLEVQAGVDGPMRGRIVFTVRTPSGGLAGHVGRGITPRIEPRYYNQGDLSTTLLWLDRIPPQAKTLVLVEGPFDALNLMQLGRGHVFATCALTSAFGSRQISALLDHLPRFERRIVLFDHDNRLQAHKLAGSLSGFQALTLPPGIKDPAELTSLDILT